MKDGLKHDKCIMYKDFNNNQSKEIFEKGELKQGYYWDTHGQLISTIFDNDTLLFEVDITVVL